MASAAVSSSVAVRAARDRDVADDIDERLGGGVTAVSCARCSLVRCGPRWRRAVPLAATRGSRRGRSRSGSPAAPAPSARTSPAAPWRASAPASCCAALGGVGASAVAGVRRTLRSLAGSRRCGHRPDPCAASRAWSETRSQRRGCARRSGRRPGRAGSRGAPTAAAPRGRDASRWAGEAAAAPTLPADHPRGNCDGVADALRQRIANLATVPSRGLRRVVAGAERCRRRHQGQRCGERCQGPSPIHRISKKSSVNRPAKTPAEGLRTALRFSPGARAQR